MARLLALLAVKDSYQGVWQRSRGCERAALVTNLGEGDVVVVESEDGNLQELDDGYNSLFHLVAGMRYRIVKHAGSVPASTTVEIIL